MTVSRFGDFASHGVEFERRQVPVVVTIKSPYELQSFVFGIMQLLLKHSHRLVKRYVLVAAKHHKNA